MGTNTKDRQFEVESLGSNAASSDSLTFKIASIGDSPITLGHVYQPNVNIAVWRRSIANELHEAANFVVAHKPSLRASIVVTPSSAKKQVSDLLDDVEGLEIIGDDIARLVDMFCCLFDVERAGLRLTTLNGAMCPRFHVDKVPVRLVTTYNGVATEWLADECVDRSRLGAGNQGMPDDLSGLYGSSNDVQQLNIGDVALLKGELWQGNEGAGIVHRSPTTSENTHRLLLTLDLID